MKKTKKRVEIKSTLFFYIPNMLLMFLIPFLFAE